MRLFVDCDDTLVLYDAKGEVHPYGFVRDEPYRWNQSLKNFIFAFREKYEDALIVIWSGGGAQYAQRVAEAMGLDELGIT